MESEDHLWYLALSFQPRGPSAWVWVPSWRCLNLVSDAPPSGYRIPQLCLSVFYAFCTGICTVSHLLLLSLASRGVTLSSSALCKTCHVDHVTLNSKWSCFSAFSAKRYRHVPPHVAFALVWESPLYLTLNLVYREDSLQLQSLPSPEWWEGLQICSSIPGLPGAGDPTQGFRHPGQALSYSLRPLLPFYPLLLSGTKLGGRLA